MSDVPKSADDAGWEGAVAASVDTDGGCSVSNGVEKTPFGCKGSADGKEAEVKGVENIPLDFEAATGSGCGVGAGASTGVEKDDEGALLKALVVRTKAV